MVVTALVTSPPLVLSSSVRALARSTLTSAPRTNLLPSCSTSLPLLSCTTLTRSPSSTRSTPVLLLVKAPWNRSSVPLLVILAAVRLALTMFLIWLTELLTALVLARIVSGPALVLAFCSACAGLAPSSCASAASVSGVMLATVAPLGSNECSTTGRPLASWPRACSSSGNTGRADFASVRRNEPSAVLLLSLRISVPAASCRLIALPAESTTRIRAPSSGAPVAAMPLMVRLVPALLPPAPTVLPVESLLSVAPVLPVLPVLLLPLMPLLLESPALPMVQAPMLVSPASSRARETGRSRENCMRLPSIFRQNGLTRSSAAPAFKNGIPRRRPGRKIGRCRTMRRGECLTKLFLLTRVDLIAGA